MGCETGRVSQTSTGSPPIPHSGSLAPKSDPGGLLVLRHNAVLRRQFGRVGCQPGDLLWLAALSRSVVHPILRLIRVTAGQRPQVMF
jgi:hypothetical protein